LEILIKAIRRKENAFDSAATPAIPRENGREFFAGRFYKFFKE